MNGATLLVYDPDGLTSEVTRHAVWDLQEPVSVSEFREFVNLAEAVEQGSGIITLVAAVRNDVDETLTRLAIVHEEYPTIPIVLILKHRDAADVAQVVRTGAVELLFEDDIDQLLAPALHRSTHIGRAGLRGPEGRGRKETATDVMVFVSPVGGAGRTFLASNAAVWLQENATPAQDNSDPRVCLIDLSGPYGAASTALRVRPSLSVAQAAHAAAHPAELEENIDEYLSEHPLGFKVLAPGDIPDTWNTIEPDDVGALMGVLSVTHDAVVVDAPCGLDDVVTAVLRYATTIGVVVRLDVPSVRALRLYLAQLDELGVPRDRIEIIINQVTTGMGMDVADVMNYLDQYRTRWLASDTGTVVASMDKGQPLLAFKPRHSLSRAIAETFAAFQQDRGGHDSEESTTPDEHHGTDDGGLRTSALRFVGRLRPTR